MFRYVVSFLNASFSLSFVTACMQDAEGYETTVDIEVSGEQVRYTRVCVCVCVCVCLCARVPYVRTHVTTYVSV